MLAEILRAICRHAAPSHTAAAEELAQPEEQDIVTASTLPHPLSRPCRC